LGKLQAIAKPLIYQGAVRRDYFICVKTPTQRVFVSQKDDSDMKNFGGSTKAKGTAFELKLGFAQKI
jgi:hypothetical protein